MQISRLIAVSLALASAVVATSQISGPIPLSWRFAAPATVPTSGTPAVDGDNIYMGVGGRVYCLDRATGNKKWQYPLIEPIAGSFSNNILTFRGTVIAAGSNKTVYAIDPATGEMKWSYDAPGVIVGKMTMAGELIVLNIGGNSMMAISADTGEAQWTNVERIFDGIRGDIFTVGTTLFYFNGRQTLFSMNVATRRSDRITTFQGLPMDAAPVVSGGNIYICSGTFVSCITPSGNARWQRNLMTPLVSGPAISTDGIAAVSRDGTMFIMDTMGNLRTMSSGGKTVPMAVKLGSFAIARPAAVGRLFAVPTANGAMNLVNPTTGEMVWSYTIRPVTAGLKSSSSTGSNNPGGATERNDEVISIPAAGAATTAGNTLLQLVADGSLLAFDAETGVDLTGPSIQLLWPQAGLQLGTVKGPLDIYFKIQDDAIGVNEKTVAITVNGKPVETTYGRDGIATLRFGTNAKNKTLGNGRAVFEVTAVDWLGNKTVSKFSFTIDNDLEAIGRPGGRPGNAPGGPGGRGGGGGLGDGGGIG